MQFFILVLLFCFFVFSFCVFVFTRDDIVLLKKDITLEKIFNLVFILSFAGFFSARLFYALLADPLLLSNFLKFIAFSNYPGFSLTGGILGAIGFLSILRKGNLPKYRLFDFFSIAFLSTLPIGYLGYFLLSKTSIFTIKPMFLIISYGLLFLLFMLYLLQAIFKKKFEDGTVGFLFLIAFSIVSLIKNYLERRTVFLNIEDFILLLILLIPLVFVFDREKLVEKIRRLRKQHGG